MRGEDRKTADIPSAGKDAAAGMALGAASQWWMVGHRVELPEMLAGREHRALRQQQIRDRFPGTLICFTLNIAGPVKVFPLGEEVFRRVSLGILLRLQGAGCPVAFHDIDRQPWGWEAYYAVEGEAGKVKEILIPLEERFPAGRLFDIDVLRPDGTKVSREEFGLPPRSCLVCGKPTIGCARSRAHKLEEIQDRTVELLLAELRGEPKAGCESRDAGAPGGRRFLSSECLGALCRQAMLMEVYTTPKPGLVDCRNNGSHRDMDVALFEASTAALESYFADCAAAGERGAAEGRQPSELLALIRPRGIQAEKRMFEATRGINTHKGMIFSLGILACAAGYYMARVPRGWETEEQRELRQKASEARTLGITRVAGEIARPAWDHDMEAVTTEAASTAGERQYALYGIGGIRREAAEGFPSVRELALPALRAETQAGHGWQDAGRAALLHLIASVVDTNVISRSDVKTAEEVRALVAEHIRTGRTDRGSVEALDDRFIRLNISPGGCADLLALSYFLFLLESLI